MRLDVRLPEPVSAARAEPGSLEQLLVARTTLGATPYELERVAALGYDEYLDEQLDTRPTDAAELEDVLAGALPTLRMDAQQLWQVYQQETFRAARELQLAAIYRAIYSPRQLFERMVIFWSDHFNVYVFDDWPAFLKPIEDREVIRRHALGSFRDLLSASVHSPAMLTYLDNETNVKEAPNENYARELMELHTLGADNGYDQKDVRAVARCLTGWSFHNPRGGLANLGEFRFIPEAHDGGKKKVLGRNIPAGGGVRDGERVIDILAGHPNTARFITTKLARFFLGYDPPKSVIDAATAKFSATDGNIKAVLRVLLRRENLARATPKLKRPFEYMVSVLRTLGAGLQRPDELFSFLTLAGQAPFAWAPPNGYPDAEGYWSGLLLPRWNFVFALLAGQLPSITFDLAEYSPTLSPRALTDRIDDNVSNLTFSKATRKEIQKFLSAAPVDGNRVAQALALGLTSPEFQRY